MPAASRHTELPPFLAKLVASVAAQGENNRGFYILEGAIRDYAAMTESDPACYEEYLMLASESLAWEIGYRTGAVTGHPGMRYNTQIGPFTFTVHVSVPRHRLCKRHYHTDWLQNPERVDRKNFASTAWVVDLLHMWMERQKTLAGVGKRFPNIRATWELLDVPRGFHEGPLVTIDSNTFAIEEVLRTGPVYFREGIFGMTWGALKRLREHGIRAHAGAIPLDIVGEAVIGLYFEGCEAVLRGVPIWEWGRNGTVD